MANYFDLLGYESSPGTWVKRSLVHIKLYNDVRTFSVALDHLFCTYLSKNQKREPNCSVQQRI